MRTETTWGFFAGFVVGGVTVALLDPRRGAARRAVLRDKGISAAKNAAGAAARRGRDLRHRLRGVVYETKARLSEEQVPDDILVERVRAQLGRPVSHPRAIDVRVQDGCVVLAGPILAAEVDDLISQVSRIAGVRSIRSELDLHDEPGSVPALQH
ncbi:MAG: BON domain-containing protein [Myxococcales bacterium]